MAEQVARGLGGQRSQPVLRWPSTAGRRRSRVASVCGGRRDSILVVEAASGHRRGRGGAGNGKEDEGEQQGNKGEGRGGEGKIAWSLYRLGPGGQGGARGLSGPTHSGPQICGRNGYAQTRSNPVVYLGQATGTPSPHFSIRVDVYGREVVICNGPTQTTTHFRNGPRG
jgi:hypothetical protein